ncbi:MAG: TIGR03560 family F420-dependent LLM class oxidoreductase [Candidatus Binatia bacterium]|nr:TIGR03560 family F420-dependent LLM class oxidoreductase [Candidatus Binatia bacterium]
MSTFKRPIRFGVSLAQVRSSWDDVVEFAQNAERLGFDSLWAIDHFVGIPDASVPIFEGWTAMAALASATERIRLGHQVLCVGFRHPPLLAKMAATLDHASHGRFTLGLGAGWNEEEFKSYGLSFPSIGTRLHQLEEALDVIKKLWTEEPVSFFGEQFHVEDAYCRPRPVQDPHPPILVGGSGEKVLLKIVAEHADIWNNMGWAHSLLTRKIGVLHKHCETLKRDPGEIEISQQLLAAIGETETEARVATERVCAELPFLSGGDDLIIAGRPAQCIERIQKTIDMGATTLMLSFGRTPSLEALELFAAEVMPAFR